MVETPTLDEMKVLVTEAARIAYEHPMDIWDYRRLSDEEKALLYATIRGQMVHMATERYPGHLYAFTDPQVEKPGGEFSIGADKAMSRAVIIRCHALVWAPRMVPKVAAPNPEDLHVFITELEEAANRKEHGGGYIDKWYDCNLAEWLLHLIRQETSHN